VTRTVTVASMEKAEKNAEGTYSHAKKEKTKPWRRGNWNIKDLKTSKRNGGRIRHTHYPEKGNHRTE